MRPESDGAKRFAVGGEHFAFSEGFSQWIWTRAGGRERKGFVGVAEGASVINDTRGARMYKMRDAVGAGPSKESASAKDVGAEKIIVATPYTDFGGGVKNGFDAGAGGLDGGRIVEGGADETDAALFKIGRGRTA